MQTYLIRIILSVCLAVQLSACGALAEDRALTSSIDHNFPDQVEFLETLVQQNSGTFNAAGIKKIGGIFDAEFKKLGFETQWIDMPASMSRAGHFSATRTFGPGPHILLIGHMDTVFDETSSFQEFSQEGQTVFGPGVSDMKGGLATILFAIKALIETVSIKSGTLTVFFTGDEEDVGQPISVSRRDLVEAAEAADYALGFEGSDLDWVITGLRGYSTWTLNVSAPKAHSSGLFSAEDGAGASYELSRIIHRFYEDVRGPTGLTLNPGVMSSGTDIETGSTLTNQSVTGRANIIASNAVAHGDLRFMTAGQLASAKARMLKVVEQHLPHTDAELVFIDIYPAMEETKANLALLQQLNEVHAKLGFKSAKSDSPMENGASDISFVAPFVTAIEGLGIDGSSAHTENEHMDLTSMELSTKRASLLILELLEN